MVVRAPVQPAGVTEAAVRRVRRTLDDAGRSLVGRHVLALCSGGVDSVVLVALLARLPRGARPSSIRVLWLDHALREDVAAERAAAAEVAARHGLEFVERRRERPGAPRGGRQAAAREWRYAVARAVASELGADVVVTGHTASDQLETALLDLAGITGNGAPSGIPVGRTLARGITLVRPLLGVERRDVEQLAAALELGWREDPSNADPSQYRRNALRSEVVPRLLQVAPDAGIAATRASARARSQRGVLDELAGALLATWERGPGRLDCRPVAGLGAAARRAVLATWLRRAGVGRSLSERQVRAVEDLATCPGRASCARVELGDGTCVRRDGYDLVLQLALCPEGEPAP